MNILFIVLDEVYSIFLFFLKNIFIPVLNTVENEQLIIFERMHTLTSMVCVCVCVHLYRFNLWWVPFNELSKMECKLRVVQVLLTSQSAPPMGVFLMETTMRHASVKYL